MVMQWRHWLYLASGGGSRPLSQQDLQHASLRGALECFGRFLKREAVRDHFLQADPLVAEQRQGGFETAAAGTHQRDLVDDDGGGVHRHRAVNSGFQNHGSARAGHGGGRAETLGVAGGVHHPVVLGGGELAAGQFGGYPGGGGDAQLLLVTAELVDFRAVRVQHHRYQQAELAIAQHGHGFARRNCDLVQDFAGRRQRFGEDRAFQRNAAGQYVQIALRQRQKLRQRAGGLEG